MLSEQEAKQIVAQLTSLQKAYHDNPSSALLKQLKKSEKEVYDKCAFMIITKTNKYKEFHNYPDLVQEGFLGLTRAIKTFNPERGSFMSWAYKYINTRIVRAANFHAVIRVPIRVARKLPPRKEDDLPITIEEKYCPDLQMEKAEIQQAMRDALETLDNTQQQIVDMVFGLTAGKKIPLKQIAKKLHMSKEECWGQLQQAVQSIKKNILV